MCQLEDEVRPTLVRPENLFRARPPEGRGFPAYASGYSTRLRPIVKPADQLRFFLRVKTPTKLRFG